MYPRIPWEMVTDPLRSTKHILTTTDIGRMKIVFVYYTKMRLLILKYSAIWHRMHWYISTKVSEEPYVCIQRSHVWHHIPEDLKNLETLRAVEPSRSIVISHLSVRRCGGTVTNPEGLWARQGRQNVGPRPGNPSAPATHFSSRMRASNTASSAKHRQLAEIEINSAHAHTTQRREKHTSIKCKASRWVSYLNRNLVLLLEKYLKFFYKTWYMCAAFRFKKVQNTLHRRNISLVGKCVI